MNFREKLKTGFIVLDGAFGTQLQKHGLKGGELPERLNYLNPELIQAIHRDYVNAGSDVLTTNTFGANRKKMGSSEEVKKVILSAVDNARKASNGRFVFLDIGPIGELIEPMGSLTFDEAYDIFKEQVLIAKDLVDGFIVETMSDLYETKAAVMAIKETVDLPVLCSMTFMQDGRTFTGTAVDSFGLTISPFADVLGINCSLGPKQILPIMKELAKWTAKPLFIQANAGIPDANMNFPVKEDEFKKYYQKYIEAGVSVLGGCCGTAPSYIEKVKELTLENTFKPREVIVPKAVCSASNTVVIDDVRVIGERINPTGKKLMKQALIDGNFDYVSSQALEQVEAGAHILDVNAGLPEIDEKATLQKMVKVVQSVVNTPLQIDCGKADAIENALRYVNGRAIVNSVNGEDKVLDAILPIVKKYGAMVVGLVVDEKGLPKTVEERIKIAEKIINRAKFYGIDERDIIIDCLTLTVSVEKDQAKNTLEAIAKIKSMYPVNATLGVSNISFGLPNRGVVNTAFLQTAIAYGLDLPIINPNIKSNMDAIASYKENTLTREMYFDAFMDAVENNINIVPKEEVKETQTMDIFYCIKRGLPQAKDACKELLKNNDPITIINDYLIPALNIVGDEYEKGILFLPQLIAAAESAKLCFNEIKKVMPQSADAKGKIIIATVKGDIHDIGKNIVKTVLENYGYNVIDLGKNVPPQDIVDATIKNGAKLVGLSALMTTTVGAMEDTIKLLRENNVDCKVMVGGAVLNEDYAKKIGADFYGKDANQSVKFAQKILG